MVEQTGVDGVVVGRGCQGRPWLFGDLQNAFEGSPERFRPGVAEVADIIAEALKPEPDVAALRERVNALTAAFPLYPDVEEFAA